MNPPILLAGLGAALIAAHHLTRGRKQHLAPMLRVSFDDLAKKTLLGVYHYLSSFLILSAAVLLAVGAGYDFNGHSAWLVKFISINFALFTVVQIVIAATSDIPSAIKKMLQWTLFCVCRRLCLGRHSVCRMKAGGRSCRKASAGVDTGRHRKQIRIEREDFL